VVLLGIREFKAREASAGRKTFSVIIDIPEPVSIADKLVQDYIIRSIQLNNSIRLLPFVFDNRSLIEMAKHYLFHRIGSLHTFSEYTRIMYKFCNWIGKQPDSLINECQRTEPPGNLTEISYVRNKIDEYIFWSKQKGSAYRTIRTEIDYVQAFFRINRIDLDLDLKLPGGRTTRVCRAITLEEIKRLLEVANVRKKVIIGILAVSGVRESTLTKLKYRHVKQDLENGVAPIHLAVEPEITKGKYHGYSTFINEEVAEWLKEYLKLRKKGTQRIPPENITDDSPLIRSNLHQKGEIKSINLDRLGLTFRKLCEKAELDRTRNGTSYELTTRSLRKFFRTQMSVLGVQKDFVEFMMGHTNDAYLDVKMVGVEYLRRVYKLSGISIRTPLEFDRLLLLKQTIERLEFKPEEVLKPEILSQLGLKEMQIRNPLT
jgi:site-specific recombinase XerD